MKKYILLFAAMMLSIILAAQTQYGYVKTKGRMVNGQVIHGQGLKGAMVSLKGRTAVVAKGDNGEFFFPVPKDKKFHIDSVRKSDYELVDYSILRTHTYSGDTIYITMEKPAQQQADLLEKERKLRRNSEAKLQRLEDSIMNLNISLDEKNRQLDAISKQREFNENYIKELAKYYATLDYDRISEFQRQVNAFLEEGEFGKALQLLRSKGSVSDLLKTIKQEEEAEAQADTQIQLAIENNEKAKAGTSIKKDELAQICFSYFQTHLMQHLFDSAAYYIEFRANIDTTNANWMFDAAYFYDMQNDKKRAVPYYEKALDIYRQMDPDDIQSYGVGMAYTLNNLANNYTNIYPSAVDLCEKMFEEVFDICDELIESNIKEAYPAKMLAIGNLMRLYANNQRYSESEQLFIDGKDLFEEVQHDTIIMNSPAMITAMMGWAENGYGLALKGYYISPEMAEQMLVTMTENFSISELITLAENDIEQGGPITIRIATFLADLHLNAQHYPEAEALLKKSLELARKLTQTNMEAYAPGLAQSLQSLGNFYKNDNRFSESLPLYDEALEICRQLVANDDKLFTPLLLDVLYSLGNLHGMIGYTNQDLNELLSSEAYLAEAAKKGRILAKSDPTRYEEGLCNILVSLGDLYMTFGNINPNSDSYKKSEAYYLEAIEIEHRLADNNAQYHEYSLNNLRKKIAQLYYSIAIQNQDEEMFRKCKQYHTEILESTRQLADDNPQLYEPELVDALTDLGNFCRNINEFEQCATYYEEALEIGRRLSGTDKRYEFGLSELLYDIAQYKGIVEQYEDAIHIARESIEICQQLLDKEQNAQLLYLSDLSLLANLYTNHMEFDEAQRIYQELLPLLQDMAEEDNQAAKQEYAINLGNASYCALMKGEFTEAEQYATEALTIDISQQWIFTNLAAAQLFQGKYDKAEQIYRQFKNELKDNFLQDLNEFEAAGVIPEERKADVERIRKMLNE
ncbi:MAG: tetratricopeptide repeat protein [Bacteroidales bacterium]|nr:tetratricopeptide repeat protein [Bacteroidales bacterium]